MTDKHLKWNLDFFSAFFFFYINLHSKGHHAKVDSNIMMCQIMGGI